MIKMNEKKAYLGDGVYALLEFRRLVLTTEDGYTVTNRIVLGPEEWTALMEYVERENEVERENKNDD